MLAILLTPTPALADTTQLAPYLRARIATERGDPARAAADYARALAISPDIPVAIRAYREALAAGDLSLAEKAIAILDRAGVAPEDATLLAIARAARAGDAAALEAGTAKLARTRLVILAPVLRAWAARATGTDPFAALAAAGTEPVGRRLATEARASFFIAAGREAEALTLIRSLGGVNAALDLRIDAAQLLAKPNLARALFAADQAAMADALARNGAKPTLGFGVSRLFARVAADLAGGDDPNTLSVTLTRAALVAEPGNDRARLLLASALGKAGATDHALAALGEVRPDGPFAQVASVARVTTLTRAGRRPEALSDAGRAAERAGAGRDEWQIYADLLADSGRVAEAVPFYQRIAAGEGAAEWLVWMQLGGALEQAGRWTEARTALARAVKLAPDEPVALNYLAYARLTRGEAKRDQLRLLERAHRLAPDNAGITDSLGWAYHLTGDTPRALPMLESAAEAEPTNAEIADHLGDAYWTLGRRFEARHAWTAAALVAEAGEKARIEGKVANGL
jgi:tetratricopeptide (TPR) repeat protein